MDQDFTGFACCPYCGKAEVFIEAPAHTKISVRCSKYSNRFYIIDLSTCKTELSTAFKRPGQKKVS